MLVLLLSYVKTTKLISLLFNNDYYDQSNLQFNPIDVWVCRNFQYISLNYYYELEAQVGDLHLLLGLQVGHHQLQDHILLCCRNSLYDNDSCNSSVVCLVMYTIYAHH